MSEPIRLAEWEWRLDDVVAAERRVGWLMHAGHTSALATALTTARAAREALEKLLAEREP